MSQTTTPTDRADDFDASLDAATEKLGAELAAIFAPLESRILPDSEICGFDEMTFDGARMIMRLYLADGSIVTLRAEHGHPIKLEQIPHGSDDAEGDDGAVNAQSR